MALRRRSILLPAATLSVLAACSGQQSTVNLTPGGAAGVVYPLTAEEADRVMAGPFQVCPLTFTAPIGPANGPLQRRPRSSAEGAPGAVPMQLPGRPVLRPRPFAGPPARPASQPHSWPRLSPLGCAFEAALPLRLPCHDHHP